MTTFYIDKMGDAHAEKPEEFCFTIEADTKEEAEKPYNWTDDASHVLAKIEVENGPTLCLFFQERMEALGLVGMPDQLIYSNVEGEVVGIYLHEVVPSCGWSKYVVGYAKGAKKAFPDRRIAVSFLTPFGSPAVSTSKDQKRASKLLKEAGIKTSYTITVPRSMSDEQFEEMAQIAEQCGGEVLR